MTLVERARNICLTPRVEWPVIEPEVTDTKTLYTSYVMVLAAIPAIAGFLGMSVIGSFFGALGIGFAAMAAVVGYVMSLVMVFVIAFISDALAPSFDGQKNMAQALKLTAYAMTAAWLAGIFQIIPFLGWLITLLGSLYSLYLFYLGAPVMMKVPEQKALGYTAVIVVVAIVAGFIVSAINGMVIGMGAMGTHGGFGRLGSAPDAPYRKDSTMGKLEDFGKKMDEINKRMETAQKSGDTNAQMQASMEALGTVLGGGTRVEAVGIDVLKPFVPETFAGLPKTSSKAEKSGMAGIMVSTAEATYGDASGKNVTLEISDSGGTSGLLGLAGWMGVQGEREDQYGSEKTRKVNDRLVHEKVSKSGGSNEFAVVLGERFVVTAKGNIELSALQAAVSTIDLPRLESMKSAGVQK